MTTLGQLVVRVQNRLRLHNFGTPPDKEQIRAILSALTAGEAAELSEWLSGK